MNRLIVDFRSAHHEDLRAPLTLNEIQRVFETANHYNVIISLIVRLTRNDDHSSARKGLTNRFPRSTA